MSDALPARGGAAALEALRRAVEAQPHGTILLAGPASPARRRLLEALSAGLGHDLEGIWLEGGDLSPALVWVRIAAALGVTPGYDARRRVLQILGDRVVRKGGLVVFAPDAETMAGDSLSSLVNNARAERGLHLVLAARGAGALAARLPEDATVVDWDGEALGVLPPSAPRPTVEESAEERVELHRATSGPAPLRPASRDGRSRAALKGTAAVLAAAALAFVLARGLSQGGSREPAESGPAATSSASPSPEPARPAPDPLPGAASSQLATAPAPEAPAAPAPAEPAPPSPDPIASAAPRDVPAESAAAPPPPEAADSPPDPAAASPPDSAAASPPDSAAAPPPDSAAAPQEAAAAPPPAPVAPLAESSSTPAPAAPPPPAPRASPAPPPPPTPRASPAPAPLARGVLSVDSEIPVRIEIDGKPYGSTPLAGVRLPRGRHRIVARYPDGASALKSVVVGDEDVAVFYR